MLKSDHLPLTGGMLCHRSCRLTSCTGGARVWRSERTWRAPLTRLSIRVYGSSLSCGDAAFVTAESDLKDASCERVRGWTARVGVVAGRARRRHDTVKCIRGIHPPPSDRRADDAGYYY